jgi:hypothetical protein
VPLKEIKVLFNSYSDLAGKSKGALEREDDLRVIAEKKAEELRSWQQFMAILLHVKKQKQKLSRGYFSESSGGLALYLSRRLIARLKGSDMDKKKFGPWLEQVRTNLLPVVN